MLNMYSTGTGYALAVKLYLTTLLKYGYSECLAQNDNGQSFSSSVKR